jgi:hypothetical protein
MSAKTPYYSSHHSPTGTHGLWNKPGLQLPAYIQNVVKGIMKSGKSRGEAIPIAIGRIKSWASGGGNVSPEVRAASAKAIAEWEADKAKAKGAKSMSSESPEGRIELGVFDSLLHPRLLAGIFGGGQFTTSGGAAAKKKKAPAKKKKKPVAKKKTAAKKSSSSSSSSKSSSTTAKKTTTTTKTTTKPKPVVPGPVAPTAKPGQVQKYKTKKLSNIQSRYDLREASRTARIDLSNPRVPSEQKREIVSELIQHGRRLDGVPIVYEILNDFLKGE